MPNEIFDFENFSCGNLKIVIPSNPMYYKYIRTPQTNWRIESCAKAFPLYLPSLF
ncbi:hypothetical protein PghCCS26_51130 [Paenibacillus glycanilyticus]|uniref:Uncharacterized protein n=1 Tax=Paenibacillus glycanilyticus TaxID=126569 RepID=A0ABQ6NSA8_9BACL|nr:hypothetical protein PghCCS26_51130 [Paenibacillus glycanilyticus]